jgi:hypothetical protein
LSKTGQCIALGSWDSTEPLITATAEIRVWYRVSALPMAK